MGFRWNGLQVQAIQELGTSWSLSCEYLFASSRGHRDGFYIFRRKDAKMRRVDS